jgi:hypothetical protein
MHRTCCEPRAGLVCAKTAATVFLAAMLAGCDVENELPPRAQADARRNLLHHPYSLCPVTCRFSFLPSTTKIL